jgi:phosphoribosylaminoimidazolecarboxamide formyltransferase / IMP cyclohydrolase
VDDSPKIVRALISVSDKTGLLEFARRLANAGVEIYSTGGTRTFLVAGGIQAKDVSGYTGFPEVMGGRVKTLHPKIFGGILARRSLADDLQAMQDHDILGFELVVVNLYPFRDTISQPNVTRDEAIEQIDIGGPSLIRAAAKNHLYITVATSPTQYEDIAKEFETNHRTSLSLRRRLARECFASTAAYDQCIAQYLYEKDLAAEEVQQESFPALLTIQAERQATLRYGENPHQKAAVYRLPGSEAASLITAKQLNGKELSYNNLLDLDSAMQMALSFTRPSAVVIKHNNPCGAASAHKLSFACRKALAGDPLSAFGGVIGFNKIVDAETAEVLCDPKLFIEAIVAPAFEPEAIRLLTTKPKWRENVRLMELGAGVKLERGNNYRFIGGGLLVQQSDSLPPAYLDWQTVTEAKASDALWDDIAFGWEMVRHVKSNAIVLANDESLVGVGAGQMSRVDSVEIAIEKAGARSRGSILASDAFFPFPDSIDRAAAAGVVAIVQPGGSKKDEDVIAACNKHRIPMIFTGQRHFKH